MKNEIKDVLMRALETELKSEDVRTYLVNTLVDNLLKLEEKWRGSDYQGGKQMNIQFDEKQTGKNIKSYRKQWGLSKKELAERAGLAVALVDHYEKRAVKMNLYTIIMLANALNVEPSWLLVWSDAEMEILEECPHCGKEAKYEITKEKLLKKRGRLKCKGCGTKILMCSECTGAHCVDQPKCFELREG
ncbi:helix-turn-helix domain-containing protein [Clostridiaceae bacterium HFYG-1003]|nr:helix-turn-helix domain-containing protein [Clostridiaceae bacterium HFYG-1003]